MTVLWHFTCDHGHDGIGSRGTIDPIPHPLLPDLGPVVWLTDDPVASRHDLGLTSVLISCDRMAYRYRVTAPNARRWSDLPDELVPVRRRAYLESLWLPGSWWVSTESVQGVLA